MIPSSLISDLRTLRPDQSPEENLLNARLVCRLLADRIHEVGFPQVEDFAGFLREVARAARNAGGSLSEIGSEPLVLPDDMAVKEVAGRLVVNADSGRPPQPHATCPHCPHAVHGTEPCQASMGTRMECGCQGSEGV